MNNFDLKKFLVENKLTANSKMLSEPAQKPTIKILKDLYYFDKLGSLGAKADVDEKYHSGAKLVFKKGKSVEDDTTHDDSEYKMITSSKRLKKGVDYEVTTNSKAVNENTYNLNDVIDQLKDAIDPTNYGYIGTNKQWIMIEMLENVQMIVRYHLRNSPTSATSQNIDGDKALSLIAADIEAYRDEELGDAAAAVGEVGMEHLGISGFGQFNKKMDAQLEQALKMYYDGKITVEEAAKKVAKALKNKGNYN